MESISWFDCHRVLHRYGLCLPTEAQREHAARAGSSQPYWCGDIDSIGGSERGIAGNVRDRSAASLDDWGSAVAWSDGFLGHAPVASFRPNRFGIHDVIGNVWGWCADHYSAQRAGGLFDAADGRVLVLPSSASRFRVQRGGSFFNAVVLARSANRDYDHASTRNPHLGVRPAARLVR